MKYVIPALAACLSLLVTFDVAAAQGGLTPAYLRTEYKVNPLGIEQTQPRLSWIVTSDERDQVQTAYRVLVSQSLRSLEDDEGDLWDSGMVSSDETVRVIYMGRPLASNMVCYWKVKVWDKKGRESAWSDPAFWSMGLLEEKDWKAKWIGLDRAEGDPKPNPIGEDIKRAQWIWYPEGNPAEKAPIETRYFHRELNVPEGATVVKATMAATGDNEFSVRVNGEEAGRGSNHRTLYVFDVAGLLEEGDNTFFVSVANKGGDPNPAGFIGVIRIEFEGADSLIVPTDSEWAASRLDAEAAKWVRAKAVGACGAEPWGELSFGGLILPPPRYLRKEFALDKPVHRAFVHATALGIFELRINGAKVGEDYFTPGWTDYDKRVYYFTYDVTPHLTEGRNAIGAVVADGWYAGYIGYGKARNHYGEKLRFLAQLHVEYEDGTLEALATDPSWRAATGPLLEADFLMGETYDARMEMPGWDRSGFDEAAWKPVDVTDRIDAWVEAFPGVPVRAFAELEPKHITEPKEGTFVFDLGRNFAGVARLKVRGEAGQKITLRLAERLNPDGTVYTENLRSARATDTYICKGLGEEVWQPRFTFHGFQYVELTGLKGRPLPETITGIALSSDTPRVGRMETSDEVVNRLLGNIYWTERANFIDVPTDCPQRDERLGWTGDAQVYIRTACMNSDVQAFFTKWLVDLEDAQREDGQYPMVAPLKVAGGDGGPAWADAGVICPWNVYEIYGDRDVLERHYDGMARFIAFCKARSPGLLPPENFHCFGDWVNIQADTPKDVIYTAYFGYSTLLMSRIAEALGRDEDASKYRELFEGIKEAFNRAYVGPDGKVKGETQCAYVMPLAFGLITGLKAQKAALHLVEKVKERGWHLSTGFVGTKDLMTTLTRIGRSDVAYRLLHNDTFPSWGFTIKHGATSIWERWNGWTPEGGFNNPGMNSFAHYAFGAVGQWMYENIGGIHTVGPSFKRIRIHPRPGGRLFFAKTSYRSIRGLIRTAWRIEEGQLHLDVEIPANTRAEVVLPWKGGEEVREVGSGRYSFTGPFEPTPMPGE